MSARSNFRYKRRKDLGFVDYLVFYHLVDRPISDDDRPLGRVNRVSTGGWEAVPYDHKGKTLGSIGYHFRTREAAASAILAHKANIR